MTTDLVLPDYAGANVRGIIPALLGPEAWSDLPHWIPEPVRSAERAVLLVLDGLGWDQLVEHRQHMPTVAAMVGGSITTVAPTTTATALCSITTGLTPGEHGLVGYRMVLGGEIVNVLRWRNAGADLRHALPPRDVQGFAPFLGKPVPIVSPTELQDSAFSEAHLRGGRPFGWRSASAIAVEVGRLLRAGERFVYAYYGGIDKTAHERGFGPYYEAELRTADRIVADVIAALPAGAALLVTADHGQVQVEDASVRLNHDVASLVTLMSGEGRFRWLHTRPSMTPALLAAATAAYGDLAWIVSRQQVLDEGWFGPVVSPPVSARLGDVALVAREPISFYDPLDTGPYELICRHGSLTSAEVMVPLVAARA